MVEAPFTFFDEEMEVLLGDAIIAPQMALGLVPKILDAVDVVVCVSKQL